MFNLLNLFYLKKKFYYAAMFAAGLMTISTSCSNEDEIINEGENSEVATGEQVIVLDMQDTDVLSTKSRPLYSTENKGAENVTDVQLFVFEIAENSTERKLKNILTINDWNLAVDYDYGRKYTLKLTGEDKLDKGKSYTIVAVGQDQDTQTVAPFIISGESGGQRFPNLNMNNFSDGVVWNPNTTAGSNFLNTEAVSEASVAEIFSGSSVPFTVSETGDGGFSATVLLKRQVAGVIGYFNRIPAWVVNDESSKTHASTAYVRLVSSNRNNQVDLTYNLDVQTDDATNGTKTESEVNGFTAATKDAFFGVGNESDATKNAYTLYEIDLKKWFKINPNVGSSPSFTSSEEYWDATTIIKTEDGETLSVPLLGANWSNGINSGNDNPKVQTNSVLAGQFVIPFNKQGEYGTLQLQLLDSIKNVIRVWDVKLDTKSIAEGKDTEKDYNIYRNHLYQIGQRGAGDTGEGGGPDEPQPLDKDQILTIKINDQWEFIHDLELE